MGLLRSLMLCVCLLMFPVTALAQEDDNHLLEAAGPLGIPVAWRTVSQACNRIGFDSAQLATSRTLYEAYRAGVKASMAKERSALKALDKLSEGDNPDWETYSKEQDKVSQQFVKELEAHEKNLMTDLRAVCSPAQEPAFIKVEQARRREQARVFTIAPGEAIDLGALLDGLKIARTPEVDGTLAQWEDSLDKILIERDRMIRAEMAKDAEAKEGGEPDEDIDKEAFRQFRTLAQRVSDLNRRTAGELAAMLPAEQGEKFTREFRVRSFPRIFGESRVSRAVKTAQARADITPGQKLKLAEVMSTYAADAGPINTRWAAAADEKFRTMGDDFIAVMEFGGKSDESKEPFYVIRKERRALDEKYLAKVNEVLNDDQQEAVKKADEEAAEGDFLPEFLPDIGKEFESTAKEWGEEAE